MGSYVKSLFIFAIFQPVAVWMFDKKDIEKWPKDDKEMFISVIKVIFYNFILKNLFIFRKAWLN